MSAEVAAIIVEPVAGNMGCIPPAPGFLQGLRELCDEHGALLIFDEVMTGFRVAYGGAQSLFGVQPDITTLGKIIGGGMPIGAYGASRKLMELVSPLGPMYQAGTLSGNPVAVAAGRATLSVLQKFVDLRRSRGAQRASSTPACASRPRSTTCRSCCNRVGSMWTLFFTDEPGDGFRNRESLQSREVLRASSTSCSARASTSRHRSSRRRSSPPRTRRRTSCS